MHLIEPGLHCGSKLNVNQTLSSRSLCLDFGKLETIHNGKSTPHNDEFPSDLWIYSTRRSLKLRQDGNLISPIIHYCSVYLAQRACCYYRCCHLCVPGLHLLLPPILILLPLFCWNSLPLLVLSCSTIHTFNNT